MEAEKQKISDISKEEFWRRHVEDSKLNPLPQKQYCQEHGLALSTFGYWKRRLGASKKDKPQFYPLTIQPVTPSPKEFQPTQSGMSLHLCKDKFRIELAENFSTRSLKKLIVTLEQL